MLGTSSDTCSSALVRAKAAEGWMCSVSYRRRMHTSVSPRVHGLPRELRKAVCYMNASRSYAGPYSAGTRNFFTVSEVERLGTSELCEAFFLGKRPVGSTNSGVGWHTSKY